MPLLIRGSKKLARSYGKTCDVTGIERILDELFGG
jgi:hypothetical protein